jgi:hypothetical protein
MRRACKQYFRTMPTPIPPTDAEIAQAIEALLAARAATASICPSDAARRLRTDEWRPLMAAIRRVAATLARASRLRITQGTREVAPDEIDAGTVRGPIRLRRPIDPNPG